MSVSKQYGARRLLSELPDMGRKSHLCRLSHW